MKQRSWFSLITCLAYCIDKEFYKAIDYLRGHDPEPDLAVRSSWHEFIRSHWDVLATCDFFTVELLAGRRLIRRTLFFVMELATREVFFATVKLQPYGKYMRQVVKILADSEDGFLRGKRYLIDDRDPLYRTAGFHEVLKSTGIEPVKLPALSPDLNCYEERFVKSIKFECLDH